MYFVERSRGDGTNAKKIYGNFNWAAIQARDFRLGKSKKALLKKNILPFFHNQYFVDLPGGRFLAIFILAVGGCFKRYFSFSGQNEQYRSFGGALAVECSMLVLNTLDGKTIQFDPCI